MKRINTTEDFGTPITPAYLIGTYNEDGFPNFCPITWVSSTWDNDHGLMVISMNGAKKTKENIARTGIFSANLVSTDMLELLDYFGSSSGLDAPKNTLPYEYENGHVLRVPTLNASRKVFECEVVNTFETSDTTTYFCVSRNCQVIEGLNSGDQDAEGMGSEVQKMALLEPVVYAGRYFKVGEYLGEMGDFYVKEK